MWTPGHRRAANRNGLRYPSDLTDDEWAVVALMIPPARHGGRKRSVNVREVLNGIFYVLWTGCQWKALPKDFPPKSTVHDYLELMIPPARHGGRKRSVNVREVLNGIFYVLWTGCQWKALRKDFPPK